MSSSVLNTEAASLPAMADLFALTKPRVMSLVVFTGLAGLRSPDHAAAVLGFTASCASPWARGGGGAHQWYEADLDALMKRTADDRFPPPNGSPTALPFGVGLGVFSVLLMGSRGQLAGSPAGWPPQSSSILRLYRW